MSKEQHLALKTSPTHRAHPSGLPRGAVGPTCQCPAALCKVGTLGLGLGAGPWVVQSLSWILRRLIAFGAVTVEDKPLALGHRGAGRAGAQAMKGPPWGPTLLRSIGRLPSGPGRAVRPGGPLGRPLPLLRREELGARSGRWRARSRRLGSKPWWLSPAQWLVSPAATIPEPWGHLGGKSKHEVREEDRRRANGASDVGWLPAPWAEARQDALGVPR